ncbi:MAG: PilZ domain-containing protein [Tepidisphaeraceae bacterium]
MELSAELFERTIRLFKGDSSAIKHQRRVHPRVGIRCHIKIVPVEAGVPAGPIEVWTRDISRAGIGIICSQKMKAGDRFVVRFPRADEAPPLALVCTIKCCSQLSQGVYAIGAVFEGMRVEKAEPAPAAISAPTPASAPAAPAPTPAAA